MTEITDEQLIEAIKAGDEAAFAELWERYLPYVSSILRRMGVPGQDVDDLAQEVFMQIAGSFCRLEYRGPGQLRSWISQIVRRLVYKKIYSKRRDAQDVAIDDSIPSGDASPEEILANKVMGERLTRAIENLPELERTVIILKYVDGYKSKEITETLGITEHMVKYRLKQAIELLLSELQKDLEKVP